MAGRGTIRNEISATCEMARQRLAEVQPILAGIKAIGVEVLGIVSDAREKGFTWTGRVHLWNFKLGKPEDEIPDEDPGPKTVRGG